MGELWKWGCYIHLQLMIQVTIDSGSKIRNQIGSKIYEMLVQIKKSALCKQTT